MDQKSFITLAPGREQPSTKEQLVKLARNIRQVERWNLDESFLTDRKNLNKFKTSCSKTGGGQGDKPPKGNYVYSCLLFYKYLHKLKL